MNLARQADPFAEIKPRLSGREALAEAHRCLYCYDAPCTAACPTHIDVPGFIKRIASGNLEGSARSILDANTLGLSCSRVCPVDVLCEGACVMHRFNRKPIEIGRLQRHAMEYFYDRGGRLHAGSVHRSERIACVGGGPASMSCAAELRRRGYAVTVFESQPMAGGLNTYGVAEYKFRPLDSQKEVDFIRSLGVEFRFGVKVGEAVALDDLEKEFQAIFLGIGLGNSKRLEIEGEHLSNIVDAISYIASYKTAVPHVADQVVVIGGGNTAIDAAVAARRLGAREVRLLYRRSEEQLSAFDFEIEHARKDGVEFHFEVTPVRFTGVEGAVRQVECSTPDGAKSFPCQLAVLAIGQQKHSPLFGDARTKRPPYFAGGDAVNGGREVVDAVAEGKRAALEIAAWLENRHG